MTAIERTAYPRFKATLSLKELETSYQPHATELLWAMKNTRQPQATGQLIILLKVVQHLGYFPKPADIPESIISYIAQQLTEPVELDLKSLPREKRYRYYHLVRDYLKIRPYAGSPSTKHFANLNSQL